MPPPKAIVCHLCNGKYFSRSFPIHLKQCEAKWKKTHSRCEYCGVAVHVDDWRDHRSHCKPAKKKKKALNHTKNMTLECPKAPMEFDAALPTLSGDSKVIECEECGTENAMWQCQECEQSLCAMCEVDLHRKGARMRHIRIPLTAKALQAKNMSISATTNAESKENEQQQVVDHRAECKFCHRRFNPDRVEKHMRICNAAKKKDKRRKVWDGPAKRIENTDFAQYKHNRSSTPEKVKEWKKNGRRWREESSQLRQVALVSDEYHIPKVLEEWTPEMSSSQATKWRKKNGPLIERKEEEEIVKPKSARNERSTSSTPRVPSSGNKAKKKLPGMRGSSVRVGNRSNKSSNNSSAKSSARRGYVSQREQKQIEKAMAASLNGGTKAASKRRIKTKKSEVPKFSRKKSTSNSNTPSVGAQSFGSMKSGSLDLKANGNAKRRSNAKPKANNFKAKPVPQTNTRPTPKPKPKQVSKMNAAPVIQKSRPQPKPKPTSRRTKSEANSLARGCELGGNVKKVFDDEPTTMNDYVERERIRRQKRSNAKQPIMSRPKPTPQPKPTMPSQPAVSTRKPIKKKSAPPTELMARLQIRKDKKENMHRQAATGSNVSINKVGGSVANKPKGSRELAFKRAAYFESLMSNQEE